METIELLSIITTAIDATSSITQLVADDSPITTGLVLASATAARVDLASAVYLESTS